MLENPFLKFLRDFFIRIRRDKVFVCLAKDIEERLIL